ncbi:MAG: YdcF family protein [Thermoanaerobaculia bacterium]
MGRSLRQWWQELGPGGATTFSLAFLSGLVTAGLPVAWRMRSVFAAAKLDERRAADAILVLGRALAHDLPTAVFRARLDHGAQLFAGNLAPRLIVSGGRTGRSTVSEAEAGRRYLVERGVPAEAVLIEARSRHTLENLHFVRETMRAAGWRQLLLVTDPLHLARASTLARGLAIEVFPSGAPDCPPAPRSSGWWLRAANEGFLLHWYHLGLAYSRAIGSTRMLDRVT